MADNQLPITLTGLICVTILGALGIFILNSAAIAITATGIIGTVLGVGKVVAYRITKNATKQ